METPALTFDHNIRLALQTIVELMTKRGYQKIEAFVMVRPQSSAVSIKWSSGEKFFYVGDPIVAASEWAASLEAPYEAGIGPWFEMHTETHISAVWNAYLKTDYKGEFYGAEP